MSRGGARPGAGRPKGTTDRPGRSRHQAGEAAAVLRADGLSFEEIAETLLDEKGRPYFRSRQAAERVVKTIQRRR